MFECGNLIIIIYAQMYIHQILYIRIWKYYSNKNFGYLKYSFYNVIRLHVMPVCVQHVGEMVLQCQLDQTQVN